ncbi:MAG: ParB N-terminal domain-containing protein [Sphingobacteriales bacterium]
MNLGSAIPIKVDNLLFDNLNPRLIEFGYTHTTPQSEIIELLWDEMAIDEIVMSIKASGYFPNEPLIAIKDGQKYVVIEGNRRLTAIKAIRHPESFKDKRLNQLLNGTPQPIIDSLDKVPVIVVKSRADAWQYIGFKHVNGPVKWGSYAKAQYIAHIHNEFQIPLSNISATIGDTNLTVQKMYQGLMVINQAEKHTNFDRNDINTPKLYFSHLYTGLQLDGFKSYLGIKDAITEDPDPVPEGNLKNLEQLMFWLFGSKKLKLSQIIRSQNPDLRLLSETLLKKEAIQVLLNTKDLARAYEASLDSRAVLFDNLVLAKTSLQKAQSQISTGYDGSEDVFDLATQLVTIAEDVFFAIKEKRQPSRRRFSDLEDE